HRTALVLRIDGPRPRQMRAGRDEQAERAFLHPISEGTAMLTSFRSLLAATVLASAVAATPALAQETGEFTISGNATLVTDYRFRGFSLSDGDFAVQGGVDVGHSSGFYVGA